MAINQKLDVRPDRVSDLPETLDSPFQIGIHIIPIRSTPVNLIERGALDRPKPGLDSLGSGLSKTARAAIDGAAVQVGVESNPVPIAPSQEPPNRLPEHLTANVPECLIKGAHSGLEFKYLEP